MGVRLPVGFAAFWQGGGGGARVGLVGPALPANVDEDIDTRVPGMGQNLLPERR
ncbi:MAG: hypothetical protein LAT65_21335 [Saccharospirillum sp.]|nr:hypothetical protein [Saccharospirillum sp.]